MVKKIEEFNIVIKKARLIITFNDSILILYF